MTKPNDRDQVPELVIALATGQEIYRMPIDLLMIFESIKGESVLRPLPRTALRVTLRQYNAHASFTFLYPDPPPDG